MAEDEEDESFGDFHFASFPNSTGDSILPQNNGQNSAFLWGEFVATSKSDLSGGPAHNLSPPHNSDTVNPDPLLPSRSKAEKARWVKPRGALPLSLFGELEEEAEEEKASGAGESRVGDGGVLFSENKNVNSEIKESPLNVNHLIANSYGQNQQMKTPNGADFNLNGSDSNTNCMNSNLNGLDTDLVDGNEGFDDDDDGWEFKAAEPEFGTGNRNPKVERKLESVASVSGNYVDGPNDLILVSNGTSNRSGEWDFRSFNSSALTSGEGLISGAFSKSKDNDTANWINSSETDKKVDSVEDLWEFKDAFPETGSKNTLEVQKVDDIPLAGLEAKVFNGNDASGSVDLFAVSDGVLQNSRKWDSGFNFNPSFMNNNSIILDSRAKGKQNDMMSSLVDENFVANENFGDFKGAHSESGSEHKSEMPKVVDSSPARVEALSYDVSFASNTEDSWLASDAVSSKSVEWEFGINFYPMNKEDIISGSCNKSKPNGLNTSPVEENDDSDENFGEFKDAFSETGPKHEEEYEVADSSPAGVEVPASSVEVQKDERSQNHREPLPMSIFSDRDLDSDDSLILKGASTVTPRSNPKDSIKSVGSNVSINDLISSLYNQADQGALVNNAPNPSDHGMRSTFTAFESDTVNNDDDFDEYSWDFKAAISGTGAEDQSSDVDLGDSPKKLSTTLEINDCLDFYCKLKDKLCSTVLCHLDNLKKDQSTAALSGEEAKANSLDEEIKDFYNELNKDNLISEEVQLEDISQREISLSHFIEVLQGRKFRTIESEYQLVKRLSLAEKDARSAVELLKDVASNITILKLASIEEQQYYVSTWSNMLSVCIQELKHGALIWKQSVQRNIQSQVLSEPQGKQYILALGEIYRVVEVLGASTRLYKPWIFLSSSYAGGLIDLLCECFSIWSSSGLEDALKSIPDLIDFEYDGTVEALLESINYMHNIDALTLQKHVFSGQPICRLSALTAGTVPGLGQVVWNGEHYFLTLANLWANRISCDPPKLPGSTGADDKDCTKRILEAV